MACGGCLGARGMVRGGFAAMRASPVRGLRQVAQGVHQAIQVNTSKIRGTYDESKYTQQRAQPPVQKAAPYRRPLSRST